MDATFSWPFLVVSSVCKIKGSKEIKRGEKEQKKIKKKKEAWINGYIFSDWNGINLWWILFSLTFRAYPYYQQTEMRKDGRTDERTEERTIGRTNGQAKGRFDILMNRNRTSGQTSLLSRCEIQSQMRVCVQAKRRTEGVIWAGKMRESGQMVKCEKYPRMGMGEVASLW